MTLKYGIFFCMLLSPVVSADAFDELDQAVTVVNQSPEVEHREFLQWKMNYLKRYAEYRTQYFSAYDAYRAKITKEWGDGELSTATQQVVYARDNDSRTIRDYKSNTSQISIKHDANQKVTLNDIKKLLHDRQQKQAKQIALLQTKIAQVEASSQTATEQKEQEKTELSNLINQLLEENNQLKGELANSKEGFEHLKSSLSTQQQALISEHDAAIASKEQQIASMDNMVVQLKNALTQVKKDLDETEWEKQQLAKAKISQTVVEPSEQTLLKQSEDIKQQTEQQLQQLDKSLDEYNDEVASNQELTDFYQVQRQKILKEREVRLHKLSQGSPENKQQLLKEVAKKNVTTYTITLPSKSLQKLAQPYQNDVLTQSKRWELPAELVYAIIHTESYFNPKAKSHIPAYGLMQVVPNSAGIDVNRFLFKENEPFSPSYLYNSEQNIEAGSAYLHILNSRYLSGIKDEKSRLYCVIAGYNTGAGNVAKAFNNGRRMKLSRAFKVINGMNSDEVYQTLLNKLPYDETRNYLEKVHKRIAMYEKSLTKI